MKFYTFHLMYSKSHRKLQKMLNLSVEKVENKHDTSLDVPHADSILQTSLGVTDSKFKCSKCPAHFSSRLLLRRHKKEQHGAATQPVSTNDCNEQYRWKCTSCGLHWRTRDLKNEHQRECRRAKAVGDGAETKESEFVDYNDFDGGDFQSDSEANNADDFEDDDSRNESKVDVTKMNDPYVSPNKSKCKKCSASFPSLDLLHAHETNQHPDGDTKLFPQVNIKQEQLDIDDLNLKTEQDGHDYVNMLMTVTMQGSGARWRCKSCQASFETREQLRTHRRSHADTRKIRPTVRNIWSCNICDAILTSRDKVRIHKNINHPDVKRERRSDESRNWGDVGAYECELCNKSFISKSKIRKHMDVHKNKGRPKRLCTVCGLELCSTYNLNNHIRTVHGRERKFHCTLCDRRFSHSHHLKTHMNRHDNIRPFQCDQCVKAFFDKTTLREHIKSVHLNLKAYACKICSRTFNRSGNMRAHMLKTHSLGDLSDVNRSFGNTSSHSQSMNVDVIEHDFTPPRIFSNTLPDPFRLMIMKSAD